MIAKAKKSIKKPLVKALGSRKRSTARVWLYKGKGDSLINDRKLEAYFPEKINRIKFEKPFILTKTGGKFFVTVKVAGGGPMGQLEASIHGLSRALATVEDRKYRPILKKAGLLVRDPREKERRKPGRAGKARAKRQSPKR
ncbi:30S ribosomal protein S9 [Candidatus Shapirobacteria bacterium CG09_land_8_20_14_0_10_38_17]|uniref:30S ribosomal protein S9 n=1 Tax=Candidatus Shapirobacteria bacterium CG09_land_8_20_14_0_10_38_17 TaxID=1974884 RepID=A0A2H0WTB5_9BACT|nr:MAG: 30S ribosomal protein S9 [Candidatus Shapirobacteria bacterium CG09_land_8_20_14_0_10_38_17]